MEGRAHTITGRRAQGPLVILLHASQLFVCVLCLVYDDATWLSYTIFIHVHERAKKTDSGICRCAFLGQVPVQVEGAVRCGDYIGPQCNGTGIGAHLHHVPGAACGPVRVHLLEVLFVRLLKSLSSRSFLGANTCM
jgi:hypothetical protein